MKKRFLKGMLIASLAVGIFCSGGLANFATLPYDQDPDRLKFVSAQVEAKQAGAVTLKDGKNTEVFSPSADESTSRGVQLFGGTSALKYIVEQLKCERSYALEFVFPTTIAKMDAWFTRVIDVAPLNAVVEKSAVSSTPFVYHEGRAGRVVDRAKFLDLLYNTVCHGGGEVKLPMRTKEPSVTVESLKAETILRTSFSTSYATSSVARKHNVALALASFDGMRIESGQTVSFNAVVGARTLARGYQTAKIIKGGVYVDGVGGGVCQSSTTLYNALLLGGMNMMAVCQHSLPPSYVPPSRDAMVNSSSADLVWSNPLPHAVYLRTLATNDMVTVALYGEKMNETYFVRSNILREISPTERIIVDTGSYTHLVPNPDSVYVLDAGKVGIESEAILTVTNGLNTSSRRIRHNTYLPIEKVVVVGKEKQKEIRVKV